MFVVGAFNPVGSGLPSSRTIATKDLVQRAWLVVKALCDEFGNQLSHCFKNFDKVVAIGWLLGDVILGVLMPGRDALR